MGNDEAWVPFCGIVGVACLIAGIVLFTQKGDQSFCWSLSQYECGNETRCVWKDSATPHGWVWQCEVSKHGKQPNEMLGVLFIIGAGICLFVPCLYCSFGMNDQHRSYSVVSNTDSAYGSTNAKMDMIIAKEHQEDGFV